MSRIIQKPIQAVLFDLGSTLIYFDTPWDGMLVDFQSALVRALHQAGIPVDGTAFPAEFQRRMEAYYSERDTEFIEYTTGYILRSLLADNGYANISDAVLAEILRQLYAPSQSHWQPEPDALPALTTLRNLGYTLAVVSNASDDADVQVLVDKVGIRPLLSAVISSAAVGVRKPNPRIFQAALEQIRMPVSAAVMVGDTLGADILGAQNLGIPGIWIDRRAEKAANRDHLGTIIPDAVIHELSTLPALLEDWNRERVG